MSQKEKILLYLKERGKITQDKALTEFRCRRLSSRISELKAEGYKIVTRLKTTFTGQRYAEYVYLGS